MEIPDYIPLPMLKNEIVNTQLSLRAANYEKNKKDIDKLTQLYKQAMIIEIQLQTQQQAEAMQQQSQQMGQQLESQEAMIDAQGAGQEQTPGGSSGIDLDKQTGQGGITGWDGRSYDQNAQA